MYFLTLTEQFIKANQLAFEEYEYFRKEKSLFNKNFFTKKLFVALLNIQGILNNKSNFTDNSRLLKTLLICGTETCLFSIVAINGISILFEIVRNDNQFDKFKSFAVLYNKHNFKCKEQESFSGVIYIKLAASIFSLSDLVY